MALLDCIYISQTDHCWYDSSNVKYSRYTDGNGRKNDLIIVFKNNRTYVYKDVTVEDYAVLKYAVSTGNVLNSLILKKYKGERTKDISLDELDSFKDRYNKFLQSKDKEYEVSYDPDTGMIRVYSDSLLLFEEKEGKVSALKFMNSLKINYKLKDRDEGKTYCNGIEGHDMEESVEHGSRNEE